MTLLHIVIHLSQINTVYVIMMVQSAIVNDYKYLHSNRICLPFIGMLYPEMSQVLPARIALLYINIPIVCTNQGNSNIYILELEFYLVGGKEL